MRSSGIIEVHLSAKLRRYLKDCETKCAADCCHNNAFVIDDNNTKKWMDLENLVDLSDIHKEIVGLLTQVKRNGMKSLIKIASRGLESTWTSVQFVLFLTDVLSCVVKYTDGGKSPNK